MVDKLWAPWRLQYITESKKETGCFFCEYITSTPENDKNNLVLLRGQKFFLLMNRYPYSNGHLMVATNRHVGDIGKLHEDEMLESMKMTALAQKILTNVYDPDGFNIGVNVGKAAGAGVGDHLHLHIVPRWNGDTNFMPVISDTRVVPQALIDTFDLLKSELEKVDND